LRRAESTDDLRCTGVVSERKLGFEKSVRQRAGLVPGLDQGEGRDQADKGGDD